MRYLIPALHQFTSSSSSWWWSQLFHDAFLYFTSFSQLIKTEDSYFSCFPFIFAMYSLVWWEGIGSYIELCAVMAWICVTLAMCSLLIFMYWISWKRNAFNRLKLIAIIIRTYFSKQVLHWKVMKRPHCDVFSFFQKIVYSQYHHFPLPIF